VQAVTCDGCRARIGATNMSVDLLGKATCIHGAAGVLLRKHRRGGEAGHTG
jgi:hypothetical protein